MSESKNLLYNPESTSGVLEKISEAYSSLTKGEKKIADGIKQYEHLLDHMSITTLSQKLGTSATSITRFCHKFHYSGYAELRYQAKYGYNASNYDQLQILHSDTPFEIKKKIASLISNSVTESLSCLNDTSIILASKAIRKADHIYLFSEGGPSGTASCIQQLMFQIGYYCVSISDTQFSLIAALQMTKNDVAIVISRTGEPVHMLEAIKLVKKQGATIVSITSNEASPVAQLSNIQLLYSDRINDNIRFLHVARICELAVFGVLQSCIINDLDLDTAEQKLSVKRGINLGRLSTVKDTEKQLYQENERLFPQR